MLDRSYIKPLVVGKLLDAASSASVHGKLRRCKTETYRELKNSISSDRIVRNPPRSRLPPLGYSRAHVSNDQYASSPSGRVAFCFEVP